MGYGQHGLGEYEADLVERDLEGEDQMEDVILKGPLQLMRVKVTNTRCTNPMEHQAKAKGWLPFWGAAPSSWCRGI